MSRRFVVQADRCNVCEKRVYMTEKVKALKKHWHKACFKCGDCSKVLALGSHLEHEGEPFCQNCYTKNFGARGFRGASFGSMIAGNYGGKAPVQSPAKEWTMRNSFVEFDTALGEVVDEVEKEEAQEEADEIAAALEKEQARELQIHPTLEAARNSLRPTEIEPPAVNEVAEAPTSVKQNPEEVEIKGKEFVESVRAKFDDFVGQVGRTEAGIYLTSAFSSMFMGTQTERKP